MLGYYPSQHWCSALGVVILIISGIDDGGNFLTLEFDQQDNFQMIKYSGRSTNVNHGLHNCWTMVYVELLNYCTRKSICFKFKFKSKVYLERKFTYNNKLLLQLIRDQDGSVNLPSGSRQGRLLLHPFNINYTAIWKSFHWLAEAIIPSHLIIVRNYFDVQCLQNKLIAFTNHIS